MTNPQTATARERAITRLTELGQHGENIHDNALFAEVIAQAAIDYAFDQRVIPPNRVLRNSGLHVDNDVS